MAQVSGSVLLALLSLPCFPTFWVSSFFMLRFFIISEKFLQTLLLTCILSFIHCIVPFLHLKAFSYFYFIFFTIFQSLSPAILTASLTIGFSMNNFKMLELFVAQNSQVTWNLPICNFWTHIYKYYEFFKCYITFLNSSFGKVQNIAEDLNFSAGMLPRECLERIRLFKRILYVFVRFSLGWIIIK